jgi:hypothetical protein
MAEPDAQQSIPEICRDWYEFYAHVHDKALADGHTPNQKPLNQALVEWAELLGKNAAYDFADAEDCYPAIRAELHKVRDLIAKQDEAYQYLCQRARYGYDSCFGWSWCLRDNLTPLFERNASAREIEECAAYNQGALPDHAVISMLKRLRQEFKDRANVIPYRKRA